MGKAVDITGLSPGVTIKSATPGASWVHAVISGTKCIVDVDAATSGRSTEILIVASDNAEKTLLIEQVTPALRKVNSNSLRLTGNGSLRIN